MFSSVDFEPDLTLLFFFFLLLLLAVVLSIGESGYSGVWFADGGLAEESVILLESKKESELGEVLFRITWLFVIFIVIFIVLSLLQFSFFFLEVW